MDVARNSSVFSRLGFEVSARFIVSDLFGGSVVYRDNYGGAVLDVDTGSWTAFVMRENGDVDRDDLAHKTPWGAYNYYLTL